MRHQENKIHIEIREIIELIYEKKLYIYFNQIINYFTEHKINFMLIIIWKYDSQYDLDYKCIKYKKEKVYVRQYHKEKNKFVVIGSKRFNRGLSENWM